MKRIGFDGGENREFVRKWYDLMTVFWQNKFDQFDIHRGALYNSVKGEGLQLTRDQVTAKFSFLEYGIYVERGTGREFPAGRGYQGENAPARRPKPWFYKEWFRSRMALRDRFSRQTHSDFKLICDRITKR